MVWIHENAVYRLINKASNTCVDVHMGNTDPGTSVVGYAAASDHWMLSQMWKIVKADKDNTNSGWKLLNLRAGTYLNLENGTNGTAITTYTKTTSAYQEWYFQDDGDYVRLQNVASNAYLDLKNASADPGAMFIGWESGDWNSQRFQLERLSRNYNEINDLLSKVPYCKARPIQYVPSHDAEYIQCPIPVRDSIFQIHLAAFPWRYEVFDCDDFSFVMKSEIAKWQRDNIRIDGIAIMFGIAYGARENGDAHAYNFHLAYNPDRVVFYDATWNGIETADNKGFDIYMSLY